MPGNLINVIEERRRYPFPSLKLFSLHVMTLEVVLNESSQEM